MVYLDYASTSYPTKYFAKDYHIPGNPNSNHSLGLEANKALDEARCRIMYCIGVRSGKVLFCRCATEAVEWLLKKFNNTGIGLFACSEYEHDSVANVCDIFHTPIGVFWGEYDLYLHQYVNQLTGTVFDIESIGKQVQSTGAFFGSDFTATIGHYPIPANLDSFCDSVWFSGHKFGCEPGIGAIWLSDRLFKYLGGEEDSHNNYGLLHGTPNVSAAVAMSYATEVAVNSTKTNNLIWGQLVNYMCTKLLENNVLHHIHDIENEHKTHAINAVYLPGFNGDALVQYLSSKGIYISPGYSACASHSEDASRVLEAFGLTKEQASQTVRISFSEDTTTEDIDTFVQGVKEFKEMFV